MDAFNAWPPLHSEQLHTSILVVRVISQNSTGESFKAQFKFARRLVRIRSTSLRPPSTTSDFSMQLPPTSCSSRSSPSLVHTITSRLAVCPSRECGIRSRFQMTCRICCLCTRRSNRLYCRAHASHVQRGSPQQELVALRCRSSNRCRRCFSDNVIRTSCRRDSRKAFGCKDIGDLIAAAAAPL